MAPSLVPLYISPPGGDAMLAWLHRTLSQFRRDVWVDPTIQPLAGWLLTVLLGFVGYLVAAVAERDAPNISLPVGYATIAGVIAIAVAVAFEPKLTRRSELAGAGPPRTPIGLRILWRAPSIVLSVMDWLLARVVASLVGARLRGPLLRYLWGGGIILGAMAAALFAPRPWGLWAALAGIAAVVAVVRRWSWIEADRDTFIIERGAREGAIRVGFREDLRDEALLGIVCLFALIPLLLRQVQIETCAAGSPAFSPVEGCTGPRYSWRALLAWLGYFGGELAKSVPFVDWSEVFEVVNASPIEPQTAIGKQIVFAVRAGLDLLLLATVVQAVGIAARIREQRKAFWNRRLDILDPFAEPIELSQVGDAIEPSLELQAVDQPVVEGFPRYPETRLKSLIGSANARVSPSLLRAAAALLQRQQGQEATKLLCERAAAEPDRELRDWLLWEANGLVRERPAEARRADAQRLMLLLRERFGEPATRSAAARRLGRLGENAAARLLRERLADPREHVAVRADAAVALAKLAPGADVLAEAEELAGSFKGSRAGRELAPVMATAHALARLQPEAPASDIAERFDGPLQPHARRAALIQLQPMTIEAAREQDLPPFTEQMVRIAPGEAMFPATFVMGADLDPEAPDPGARPDQCPATAITMTRAYAINRFPVTNREFAGFREAMGLAPVEGADRLDMPVVNITWRDASDYARWLERITGERYRLPSEAEGEYACRAGTATRYWWGDDWDEERIPKALEEVTRHEPNPWGVWDLYGNVYEWCADPWHPTHEGRPRDGSVWLAGGDPIRRVVRGGSWSYPTGARRVELRSSYRNERVSTDTATNFGFRLARTLAV